jgi:hypothetical protein
MNVNTCKPSSGGSENRKSRLSNGAIVCEKNNSLFGVQATGQ